MLLGVALLLGALLLAEIADRLEELALRPAPTGWLAFVTPLLALTGIVLAGSSTMAADLALLLAIILVADRWRRTGGARPWMIVTPGTVLLMLMLAMRRRQPRR